MDLGDENTILMGDTAYKNLIDMTSDVSIEDDFIYFNQVRIKHGVFLDIYQYCPEELEFINHELPSSIEKYTQFLKMNENLVTTLNQLFGQNNDPKFAYADKNNSVQALLQELDQYNGSLSDKTKYEKE